MKAKRIQQHEFSFTINAKGTALGWKEKHTARNKKVTGGKVTNTGKHAEEAGHHPHTSRMIQKPAVVRRGE